MPQVKNTHFKTVYLESGPVKVDEIGEATDAEFSTLSQYLELIPTPAPEPAPEPVPAPVPAPAKKA